MTVGMGLLIRLFREDCDEGDDVVVVEIDVDGDRVRLLVAEVVAGVVVVVVVTVPGAIPRAGLFLVLLLVGDFALLLLLMDDDREGNIIGLVPNAFNVAPGLLDGCVATTACIGGFNVVMVGVD
jgi:hypothetical protein